jgi:hypothetical protein
MPLSWAERSSCLQRSVRRIQTSGLDKQKKETAETTERQIIIAGDQREEVAAGHSGGN